MLECMFCGELKAVADLSLWWTSESEGRGKTLAYSLGIACRSCWRESQGIARRRSDMPLAYLPKKLPELKRRYRWTDRHDLANLAKLARRVADLGVA